VKSADFQENNKMTPYSNLGGDSGVSAYEIDTDSIVVRFSDGKHYEYNATSPGTAQVDEMKALAIAGEGLNSYINRVVRKNFSRKW